MNDCIICYDKCDDKCNDINYKINCKCKMSYHKKCIEEWLNIKNKCPICRQTWEYNDKFDTTKYIICYCTINILYVIALLVVL